MGPAIGGRIQFGTLDASASCRFAKESNGIIIGAADLSSIEKFWIGWAGTKQANISRLENGLLKPAFWAKLDGKTSPSPLGQVLDVLPDVAKVRVDTHKLIVMDYQQWKERVKAQRERK